MHIRLRVKEVAVEKKISQGKLSRNADVDTNTMRRIYRYPESANVTLDILNRLANALGVDVRELLESVPDVEPGQEK